MSIFLFLLPILKILGNIQRTDTGYVEIVETRGCESCKLTLTCRHLSSVIAIFEVNFLKAHSDGIERATVAPFSPQHPRDALNQRCSGVNHCSFILTEDSLGSESLGPGNITVKYACVTEDRIQRYCNTDISLPSEYKPGISDGFIQNPGYPRFYSGQRVCRWRINARPPQKVRITILDISLIVDNVAEGCTDVLEVLDTGQVIRSSCRQEHPPEEVLSGSGSVEVVLNSTQDFNPMRGVLIHYTVVGCPELAIPSDAYIVYRTKELVVLSCCLGFTFPDTRTKLKTIKCLGAYWNTSLPLVNCEKSSDTTLYHNRTIIGIRKVNRNNMSSDLIAPISIIVILFIINGVIVFYINKARKKQELKELDEELGTFTSSPSDA